MPDFLMNVVSPTDQWMYITSNGALTAGRIDANSSLFPYYTQDKLVDLEQTSGSMTQIHAAKDDESTLWRPFTKQTSQLRDIQRSVFKSPLGNEVIFEEIHESLQLCFSYSWAFSPRFGFVRQAELTNLSDKAILINWLDGIQNLVPYGIDQAFINRYSNLADAYKKSELVEPDKLGIYYLSSIPTDRAEPSEGLKATIAWSINYSPDATLLCRDQLTDFERGNPIHSENDIRGKRGAYFHSSKLELGRGESFEGFIVADINQDAGQIEALRTELDDPNSLLTAVQEDIANGQASLEKKLSAVDAFQLSADSQRCARHLSNVLFNTMRGGIFFDNYQVPTDDYSHYLQQVNKTLDDLHRPFIKQLPDRIEFRDLITEIKKLNDPDLLRTGIEYLPLTFSRRHGDPSRPWNAFSIRTTDSDGKQILAYQGNWRDIFQNWEALALSYPEFLTGMIFRFLNASTIDGYNPYRLTKEGFDWEIPDADEPWSNIGYWGDHQIIYLLKLLELSNRLAPEELSNILDEPFFVCAHVPYRLAGFEETWNNPQNTVTFDYDAQQLIDERVKQIGEAGKLLVDSSGKIFKLTLLEKLLIPLLSKLSNFVPEGGIWMNTQRPEWNDANNALVGNGLSVVTLGYLHRYLDFLEILLGSTQVSDAYNLQTSLLRFVNRISQTLSEHAKHLAAQITPQLRYEITKTLSQVGTDYRNSIQEQSLNTDRENVSRTELTLFIKIAKTWVRHSLRANGRNDGLYHSYNLLEKGDNEIGINRLNEMLEGQVSILSAKLLTAKESVELLNALRSSPIYREDRRSYMLYPDRDLPTFLNKNIIDGDSVSRSSLLTYLLTKGDKRIVYQDSKGQARFNGAFRNSADLMAELNLHRETSLHAFTQDDFQFVKQVFEDTFQHHAFTGRSGTFFAYEGLGSIYWHMVSKLLLAIQETYHKAVQSGEEPSVTERLAAHYDETLEGLGLYQKPSEYGAFPSDAYSHTPKHSGAQQPGMTGQVKEDILIRWGELGLEIDKGQLRFRPRLLRSFEFLKTGQTFKHQAVSGKTLTFEVGAGEIAFTYCQVPILYTVGEEPALKVNFSDGSQILFETDTLPKEQSKALFSRDGSIESIRLTLPAHWLR